MATSTEAFTATIADDAALPRELALHWRVLTACLFGMMVSAAVLPTYAIGAFVLPLQAEFGWSRPQIQAALLFSQGGCALSGLVAGVLATRFGIKRLAILGLLGTAASFAAGAAIDGSLVLFYAVFVGVAIVGGGSVPVIWCRIVAGTFERQRGMALAIALVGTGIAGTLVPSALVATNAAFGWRAGFVLLGLIPLATALPLVLAWLPRRELGNAQRHVGPGVGVGGFTLLQAVRSHRFWTLMISVVLLYVGVTGILPNVIPAMMTKGMTQADAALVQSGYAISLIAGRLAIGWLLDRFWGPAVAALALTPAAIGSLLLTGEPHFGMALTGIALVGIAGGAELDLLAYFVSRYFGVRYFSSVYGTLYASVAAASATGPVAFAWLQQASGSYDLCFYTSAVSIAIAGVMILALGRYPREFPTG